MVNLRCISGLSAVAMVLTYAPTSSAGEGDDGESCSLEPPEAGEDLIVDWSVGDGDATLAITSLDLEDVTYWVAFRARFGALEWSWDSGELMIDAGTTSLVPLELPVGLPSEPGQDTYFTHVSARVFALNGDALIQSQVAPGVLLRFSESERIAEVFTWDDMLAVGGFDADGSLRSAEEGHSEVSPEEGVSVIVTGVAPPG